MDEPGDSASKFHQILISSAMPIVASLSRALKTTEEIPTLSKALVVYLEDNQKILPVLRWCIRNDIKGADAWQEVFRGKSLSVQILSDYFIHSGRLYVKNVLLNKLKKQTKNLEIDSRFEKDPQVIAENVEKLTKLARETLDGIIESAGQFPVNLSRVLKYMVKQVNKKFPDKGMVVAGMILFSKLYIPPILTPQLLDSPKENTSDVSRTAILLSKLMQSVAAGTPLDSSNILFKFNDFIVYYAEKLRQFTYGLASVSDTPTISEMSVKIEPDVAKKSFQTIHNFIHQYRHTMLEYRVTKKNASEIKIFQDLVAISEQMLSDLVDGKPLFDELPYVQDSSPLSRSRSPTVTERGRKDGPSSQPLSPRSPEKKIKQPTSPRFAALEDSSSGNEKEISQARAIKAKLDDENTRLRKEIKIMQQKIEEKEKLLRQFKLKLAKSLAYRQRKTRHVRQVQKKLVNERFNIRNIDDLDKPLGIPFDPRNRSSTLETPRASSDAGYDASTSPLSSPRNNASMKDEYSFDASTWSVEEESSRSDSQRSRPSESSESLPSSRKDISPQRTSDRKGSSTKTASPSSKLLDRVRTTPAPAAGSTPKTPGSERKSTTTVEK